MTLNQHLLFSPRRGKPATAHPASRRDDELAASASVIMRSRRNSVRGYEKLHIISPVGLHISAASDVYYSQTSAASQ